jgi:DNA-directed RNA polymerase subunit RPC12/RpoP
MQYICDKCGQPTDNTWDYKDHFGVEIIKKYGWENKSSHTCDSCEQKEEEFEEWKNEKYREKYITCPWCGYQNCDSWEYSDDDEEIPCGSCGRLFDLEVHHETTYTTRKSEIEYDKEDEE